MRTTTFTTITIAIICCIVAIFSSSQLLLSISPVAATLPELPSFNTSQFLGRFYQAWSDASVMYTFERNGVCIFAEYGLLPNGSVSVYNEMRLNTADGELKNIIGHADESPDNVPGHFMVRLGAMPFAGQYWIISTGPIVNDLYDYIIVTDSWQLTMWVLVRDLDRYFAEYDAQVQEELQQLGFTWFWNKPLLTMQDGCNYTEWTKESIAARIGVAEAEREESEKLYD